MKQRFQQFLRWWDTSGLFLVAGFLLAFIPLWPKIPVWSPIEQYIVRVRLEDFFLFASGFLWLIQLIRRKIVWRSPFFWMILAYEVVSFLSLLSAMFLTKTIPLQVLHVEKSWLHFFRYIEYFYLLFLFLAAVKKRSHVVWMLIIFAFTVIAVSVYGYGQKYFYWPVYSTMNREFSKGVRLVLTPHARVQSTFGGHYDMAAFLVIALPLLLAAAYATKNRLLAVAFHMSFWLGTWLVIESAARTSFVAFLGGLVVAIGLSAFQKPTWFKRIRFTVLRGTFLFLILGVLYIYFGADLNDRLAMVIQSYPAFHGTFTFIDNQHNKLITLLSHGLPATGTTSTNSGTIAPPKNSITTDQAIALGIIAPTDERPIPAATPTPTATPIVKPTPTAVPVPKTPKTAIPADVYVNVPTTKVIATKSATGQTVNAVVEVPRTYSENAIKYGLSMGIRLDTLWPNAIRGFLTNPLLGKGYATLNKESNDQFTEAESTDNNFLRTLGETGLLGFITFYGCVVLVFVISVQAMRTNDVLARTLGIGIFSGTLGLLINASFLDVFASSKVAQTYWSLVGLLMAYLFILRKEQMRGVVPEEKQKMLRF